MQLRSIGCSIPSRTKDSLKRRQFKAGNAGYTLVEILVTLAVLSTALPALMYSFRNAAQGQALSENRTTALYLLKFRMAEIALGGYPDIGEEDGEFGENSRFRWRSKVQDVVSDEIENLRLITVTLTWQERGTEESISMNTYMADREKQPQGQGGGQQPQGGENDNTGRNG